DGRWDRTIADARIGLVQEPADFRERDFSHTFSLVLPDPLFRHQFETIVLRNLRARLLEFPLVRRIKACGDLAPRLVTLRASVGQADRRPGAESQSAVS